MKRFISFILVAVFASVVAARAEKQDITLYIQVVCASEKDKPADAKWTKIGPKLQKRLGAVFRWKDYWEVSRHEVTVTSAKPIKKAVTQDRTLKLALLETNKVEVSFIRNGKVGRVMRYSLDSEMMIGGWDAEETEAWFIVVRKSKPTYE